MIEKINKKSVNVLRSGKLLTETAINTIDNTVIKATSEVETYINPVRQSVLNRFPILFSLLVTFGLAVTFLGFEKIVSQIDFLDQNPLLMLILGICILAITGTLYKKLS